MAASSWDSESLLMISTSRRKRTGNWKQWKVCENTKENFQESSQENIWKIEENSEKGVKKAYWSESCKVVTIQHKKNSEIVVSFRLHTLNQQDACMCMLVCVCA